MSLAQYYYPNCKSYSFRLSPIGAPTLGGIYFDLFIQNNKVISPSNQQKLPALFTKLTYNSLLGWLASFAVPLGFGHSREQVCLGLRRSTLITPEVGLGNGGGFSGFISSYSLRK